MFMSVDLPAPFSPRSAWISPRRSAVSIAAFARVPVGNSFVIPRISRTGGWSVMRSARDERADPGAPAPSGAPTPEAGPLDLDSLATHSLGDGLQLPGCHVRDRLLELVFESGGNRVQVADRRGADTAVGGVVHEVAGLLAFVLEALDRIASGVLQVLFGAGDDAGLGVRKGLPLIDVHADSPDLRAARGA